MGNRRVPKPNKNASAIPKTVPKPPALRFANGDGCLRIRLTTVDVGGPFCLTEIDRGHFGDLIDRLKAFESMSYDEVMRCGMGKIYQTAELPNPTARARLVDLEFDDQTEIACLRITGRRRLFGFLPNKGPDFWALWWDPEHEIWPSKKKHT